jgi:hypothetical protein
LACIYLTTYKNLGPQSLPQAAWLVHKAGTDVPPNHRAFFLLSNLNSNNHPSKTNASLFRLPHGLKSGQRAPFALPLLHGKCLDRLASFTSCAGAETNPVTDCNFFHPLTTPCPGLLIGLEPLPAIPRLVWFLRPLPLSRPLSPSSPLEKGALQQLKQNPWWSRIDHRQH